MLNDGRQNFVIEPHDTGFTSSCDVPPGTRLASIQRRRVEATGVWITMYRVELTERAKENMKRQFRQRRKALRTGKRLRPFKPLGV